jgi:hypothetical protein
MIATTGFALMVLAGMTMFLMDDADPYQEFFPWAWKLVHLVFMSGVVLVLAGAVTAVWRFLG